MAENTTSTSPNVLPHQFNWRRLTSGVCGTCGGGYHDPRHLLPTAPAARGDQP